MSSPPYAPHALPISSYFTWSPQLMKLNVMSSNDSTISDERIGKEMEGSGHGIMCGTISAFRLKDWVKPRKHLTQDRRSPEGTWNHKLPSPK
jgi:hypothetical protein